MRQMWSLTWVGVKGSSKGCLKTYRIASVSPILWPPLLRHFWPRFNRFSSSASMVSPHKRASCSTTGIHNLLLDLRLLPQQLLEPFTRRFIRGCGSFIFYEFVIQKCSHIVNRY